MGILLRTAIIDEKTRGDDDECAMSSVEFLRPQLHGPRFDDGGIPLEFLGDLAALQELVVEVAKWRFLQDNPGRQRSPRGFTDAASLKLIRLESGSAVAVIALSDTSHSLMAEHPPHRKYYDEAVHYIIDAINVAGQNLQQWADHALPKKFLAYFDRIGRSLRDEEYIEFSAPAGRTSARLDGQKRRNMLAVSRVKEPTEEVSLHGTISEVDQQRMTFKFQLISGRKVSGPIAEQHYDSIMEAFNAYRGGSRVLVRAIGKYDQQNRLRALDSIQRVTSIRPRDVPARLDEFRDMQDGWYEGWGIAPKREGLDWLSTAFERYYPDDAPLPYTYPNPEGSVRMEWSAGNNAGILEIDIDAHSAEWLWFDRDSDDECERTLNMDESADWQWLASEIRSKLTTGAA